MNKLLQFLLLVLIFIASFVVWYLLGAFIANSFDTTAWTWYGRTTYIVMGYITFLQAIKLLNK